MPDPPRHADADRREPVPPVGPPPAEWLDELEAQGLEVPDEEIEALRRYLELLLDANTRFNLTAVRDPVEAWWKHIFDSLTLLPLLQGLEAHLVADLGSGGGLPGLPLAITMPEVRFVLIESTGKKARFLEETVAALGLTNVEVLAERAETVARLNGPHRERFDVVVCRAVGRLAVLVELAAPLLRVGGHLLAVKGEKAGEELKDARRALERLRLEHVETIPTPTGRIVVIEKSGPTPREFPRRPGEAAHDPLR